MPKRRIVKPIQGSSDSDDSDPQPSQARKGPAKKALSQSSDELERVVNDFVYFAIVSDQKKTPFKRLDVTKNVIKDHACTFVDVLPLAREKLKQVFGFDIVELEKVKGSYFLVNVLKHNTDNSHLVWSEKERNKSGLLLIILALIHFNGNSLQEALLWQLLKKMGIDVESPQPHEVFGDVKKLITQEFRQQLYLEINKLPRAPNESPASEILWGQRAHKEVTEEKIKEFGKLITGEEIMAEAGPTPSTSRST